MLIEEYLQIFVRPMIGDVKKQSPLQNEAIQTLTKYSDAYLLSLYNEAILDVTNNTKYFNKKAYFLITEKQKELYLPSDYIAFYGTTDDRLNVSGTDDTRHTDGIDLRLSGRRLVFKDNINLADIKRLNSYDTGVVVSQEVINNLVASNQLTLSGSGVVYPDFFKDKVVTYIDYLYRPKWLDAVTEEAFEDKTLLIALKYYIGAKALESDQPNEATNKGLMHYKFYLSLRETLDDNKTNWDNVQLSTYMGDI